MCDSIGGCMKKLVVRVVLALFVANVASTSMAVEASWLSKQLDNLFGTGETVQTEADRQRAEEMRDLPKSTDADYEYIRNHSRDHFGKPLADWEFTVAGVPMGAHVNDIIKSLGKPTSEKIKYYSWYRGQLPTYHLEYGGLSFDTQYMYWYHEASEAEYISKTTINNRDAATARGITVGDTLKEVYNAYGKPVFITKKNEWFYGAAYPDEYHGIWFVNDGYKVTKIKLGFAVFEHDRTRDNF